MTTRGLLPSISLCVLISLSGLRSDAAGEEFIRIASFNIAEFGEGDHPTTRDLSTISKMLVDNDLDLIAIQEVGVAEQALRQVMRLKDAMNNRRSAAQPKYFAWVSPLSGDERYAVIYRFPVVKGDEIWWLDDDKVPGNPRAGGTIYFRVPVAIPFSARNFDFVLVNMHLTWGNLERRSREMAALRKFLADDNDPEKDWIAVGDMNRYGKYSKSTADKGFDQLLSGSWKNVYRFPLLEAITEPDDMQVFRASVDGMSTTVAQSKNVYDQIIITQGAFREFGTTEPKLGTHVGIIAFDTQAPFNAISDHNEVKYRVSDHRPIWARFRIDLEDDD